MRRWFTVTALVLLSASGWGAALGTWALSGAALASPVEDAASPDEGLILAPSAGPAKHRAVRERTGGAAARKGGKSKQPVTTPKPAPTPAPAPAPTQPTTGIVSTGPNSWSIPESIVNKYEKSPKSLKSQASVVQVDGGWKITAVRGAEATAAGLKKGDIITEVNGHSLDGMMKTVLALPALKNEPSYRVRVIRAGKAQTLKYDVVEGE